MNTLSKIGRKWICRKLNIMDKEGSFFVENQEAFCDRISLFRVMFNTYHIIELYKKELSTFDSEEDYNRFLEKACEKVKKDIEGNVNIARNIEGIFSSDEYKDNLRFFNNDIEFRPANESNILRIYFDYPVYEGYKYICDGIFNIERNVHDYIIRLTNSEFLAYNVDINWFTTNIEYINTNMKSVGASLLSLVSPKFLNSKELISVGNSEVQFVSSRNKPIEHIDNIINYIENNEYVMFSGVNIEIFKIKSLASNNSMSIKINSLNDKDINPYNIVNYKQYDLIRYLRRLYNEPLSEYDSYVEMNNSIVKIIDTEDINWH